MEGQNIIPSTERFALGKVSPEEQEEAKKILAINKLIDQMEKGKITEDDLINLTETYTHIESMLLSVLLEKIKESNDLKAKK